MKAISVMTPDSLPPASGAWREGDDAGERRFAELGPFTTESGFRLPQIRLAYECWGTYQPDGRNAVYISHSLTGDSHVHGPAGPGHHRPGWWSALVGPGLAIDTRRWFVVCANVLGGCQGSTGPASLAPDGRPWGSRFPTITVRDMVAAERRLSDALGINSWALMVGPSLGGMRVLEWLVSDPTRVRAGLVIGTTAASRAEQIGRYETQIAAIRADHGFCSGDYYDAPPGMGPHRGLGLAHRIALLSNRSHHGLDHQFGRTTQQQEDPYQWKSGQSCGRFAISAYLEHEALKLAYRFDANSYITLTRAMSLFDLGRNRNGCVAALKQIRSPLTVVGTENDQHFPVHLQKDIARHVSTSEDIEVIRTLHGHDGFAAETSQMADILAAAISKLTP